MQTDHAASETSAFAPEHGITIQDASAWVLRVGVISSVIIMLVGTMISFFHHPVSVQYMEQTALDDNAHNLWRGLRSLRGQAIIELGIYVLVLTPVLRVVTSMVLFCLEEKDWLYTIVTLVVLILTLVGLLLLK